MLTLTEREMEAINSTRERLAALSDDLATTATHLHGLLDRARKLTSETEALWAGIAERNSKSP